MYDAILFKAFVDVASASKDSLSRRLPSIERHQTASHDRRLCPGYRSDIQDPRHKAIDIVNVEKTSHFK